MKLLPVDGKQHYLSAAFPKKQRNEGEESSPSQLSEAFKDLFLAEMSREIKNQYCFLLTPEFLSSL